MINLLTVSCIGSSFECIGYLEFPQLLATWNTLISQWYSVRGVAGPDPDKVKQILSGREFDSATIGL